MAYSHIMVSYILLSSPQKSWISRHSIQFFPSPQRNWELEFFIYLLLLDQDEGAMSSASPNLLFLFSLVPRQLELAGSISTLGQESQKGKSEGNPLAHSKKRW